MTMKTMLQMASIYCHILLWVGNSSRTMVRTLNTMDARLLLERMARIGTSTLIRAWVRVSNTRMLGR